MKIRIYILTYNNEDHLNSGLESLFNSEFDDNQVEVYVINNHTNFNLHSEFVDKTTVLHNVLQPDFGMGHSSRNWNQALMHGFKNLNDPDCDLVICVQDDTHYHPNWLRNIIKAHTELGMEFVACGNGDNLCSYTPEAVKQVGLWDERFCMLAYGEHDYFLRAVAHLGARASICDTAHGGTYTYNRLSFADEIIHRPDWSGNKMELHLQRHHSRLLYICRDLFITKWGQVPESMPIHQYENNRMAPLIKGYIFYPYFEKDILNLNEKGYNWGTPYDY